MICPASPAELYNDIFAVIVDICARLTTALGIVVECKRAVDITSSGVIHPEIWTSIRLADFLVADVTGANGNVMLELGVAAAWHRKEKVIIIRESNPSERHLFDIIPARHLEYSKTPSGFNKLAQQLFFTIQEVIANAPFEETRAPKVDLPFSARFDGRDSEVLLTPGMAHRRIMSGRYLEFGSLYNFRYGWLTLGDVQLRNVHVKTELQFSVVRNHPSLQSWIGVMVRSQGYLANKGHLLYVRSNGTVCVTLEQDAGAKHDDLEIGRLVNFDAAADIPLQVEVWFNDNEWAVKVGNVEWSRPVDKLPFVFSDGRVLVEGYFCWIGLRSLEVTR